MFSLSTTQARFASFLVFAISIWILSDFYAKRSRTEVGTDRVVQRMALNVLLNSSADKKDDTDAGALARKLAPAVIDINTADVNELMKLPLVGRVLAMRIIEHREKKGKFKSVDELLKIEGIGPKKLEKIRPLVVVN